MPYSFNTAEGRIELAMIVNVWRSWIPLHLFTKCLLDVFGNRPQSIFPERDEFGRYFSKKEIQPP